MIKVASKILKMILVNIDHRKQSFFKMILIIQYFIMENPLDLVIYISIFHYKVTGPRRGQRPIFILRISIRPKTY